MKQVPFIDLRPDDVEEQAIIAALARVVRSGQYLLGPETAACEHELAAHLGTGAAVTVGSGTDALSASLVAVGVRPGDEVILPAFTAFATAAAVTAIGATPVLVDVERARPVLDGEAALAAVTPGTKAVIAVHLFGCVADVGTLRTALEGADVAVVEDCAQAQGACFGDGTRVGARGTCGAFSFYPTKNLGGLGDGGAVVTDDPTVARRVRAWRAHGVAEDGSRVAVDRNSRLSEVGAAVLRLRLALLDEEVDGRRHISDAYAAAFAGRVDYVGHGPGGAPHLAVIRCADPDQVAARLAVRGIGTGRHYPRSLADEEVLAARIPSALKESRGWAASCLSLPLRPRLADEDLEQVIEAVLDLVG